MSCLTCAGSFYVSESAGETDNYFIIIGISLHNRETGFG